MAPAARVPNPADEVFSLTKTVSRMEQIKEKAAGIIGVDLHQSETYPIKWWLVPPLTFARAGVMIELRTPLGTRVSSCCSMLPRH